MSNKPKNIKLDEYEQDLEDNFDRSEPLSAKEEACDVKMLKSAATNYLKKDQRITIRVYSSDLERIKLMAAEEGLPYQTFITSVLHKLSTGRMKDSHN